MTIGWSPASSGDHEPVSVWLIMRRSACNHEKAGAKFGGANLLRAAANDECMYVFEAMQFCMFCYLSPFTDLSKQP